MAPGLCNIRLYRLALALRWYAEAQGIKEIEKRIGDRHHTNQHTLFENFRDDAVGRNKPVCARAETSARRFTWAVLFRLHLLKLMLIGITNGILTSPSLNC